MPQGEFQLPPKEELEADMDSKALLEWNLEFCQQGGFQLPPKEELEADMQPKTLLEWDLEFCQMLPGNAAGGVPAAAQRGTGG